MKTIDIDNIEEAAAESEQDRRDHAALAGQVAELLNHEDAMRVPIAVRRLVDDGIDPVVIAKTLLIGTRPGGVMYTLTSRAAALEVDEHRAELWIVMAIREGQASAAATMLVAGAVWIATQFKLDRTLLRDLVQHAPRRARRTDRLGYGAVDFVDSEGIANRAWLLDAINHAQLPAFAPLEYKPR